VARHSRRDVLKGCCAAILSASAFRGGSAVAGDTATLSIDQSSKGTPVAPNFAGLSFETALLSQGSLLTAANRSLVSLVRSLGPQGVIRLGGNTSDRPFARPSRTAIGELAGFLHATGWSLIYGVNLGTGSPLEAADEARDVVELAGPSLIAFQIGNEPDLYDRGLRQRGWNVDGYLAEWDRFAGCILAQIPEARFAGPDLGSQPGWLAPFASLRGRRVALLSRHYYGDGPAWSPLVSVASILQSDANLAGVMQEAKVAAASAGLPLRMTEANSVYCGGKPGVSDTLAAAVWGADLMFQLAEAGWQGINFHGGSPEMAYSPIVFEADHRSTARPLYQAMLFFAEAAASRMLPVRLSPRPGLRGYALRALDGRTRVAITNKDLTETARVTIVADADKPALLRLTGPDPAATAVTTADQVAARGNRDWRRPLESAEAKETAFTVEVAPCSAVLIDLDGRSSPLINRPGRTAAVANR
jgi:hypothetical protein